VAAPLPPLGILFFFSPRSRRFLLDSQHIRLWSSKSFHLTRSDPHPLVSAWEPPLRHRRGPPPAPSSPASRQFLFPKKTVKESGFLCRRARLLSQIRGSCLLFFDYRVGFLAKIERSPSPSYLRERREFAFSRECFVCVSFLPMDPFDPSFWIARSPGNPTIGPGPDPPPGRGGYLFFFSSTSRQISVQGRHTVLIPQPFLSLKEQLPPLPLFRGSFPLAPPSQQHLSSF